MNALKRFYLGTDDADFTDKLMQIHTGKQCLSASSVPKKKQKATVTLL